MTEVKQILYCVSAKSRLPRLVYYRKKEKVLRSVGSICHLPFRLRGMQLAPVVEYRNPDCELVFLHHTEHSHLYTGRSGQY